MSEPPMTPPSSLRIEEFPTEYKVVNALGAIQGNHLVNIKNALAERDRLNALDQPGMKPPYRVVELRPVRFIEPSEGGERA